MGCVSFQAKAIPQAASLVISLEATTKRPMSTRIRPTGRTRCKPNDPDPFRWERARKKLRPSSETRQNRCADTNLLKPHRG
jgi:hypothetical protein